MARFALVLAALMLGLFVVGTLGYAGLEYYGYGNLSPLIKGSGKVVKETRPVCGIRTLESCGGGEVFVTQGPTESLQVEAEDNLLPLLTSTVTDGKLCLSMKPRVSFATTKPIRFYLTVKDLSSISILGSGGVQCSDLKTENLALFIGGSGDIAIKTEAKRVAAECMGSGNASVDATAENMKLTVGGSGDVKGNLRARRWRLPSPARGT